MTHGISMLKGIFSSWVLECKHMTLAISMLNDISPLRNVMQNYYLKHPEFATLRVVYILCRDGG